MTLEHKIPYDQIKMPKPGFAERLMGNHYRKRGEAFISASIREHATFPDGRVDNELADYVRKKLTQRVEVSMQRDVIEPASWPLIAGLVTGAAAVAIGRQFHEKPVTKTAVMATVTATGVGAVLDWYRMTRRFDSAMRGALKGALEAMKEERSPHAQLRREENALFAQQVLSSRIKDDEFPAPQRGI